MLNDIAVARERTILETKAGRIAAALMLGVVVASGILSMSGSTASARAVAMYVVGPSKAVKKVWDEAAKDPQRSSNFTEARRLYEKELLTSAADYFMTAKIMSASHESSDLLVAHNLSVVALAQGYPGAGELSLQTENAYLKSIGKTECPMTHQVQRALTAAGHLQSPVPDRLCPASVVE